MQNAALKIIQTENYAQDTPSSLEFTQIYRFRNDTLKARGLEIAKFHQVRQLNISLCSQ
jgi:hypothetical protein